MTRIGDELQLCRKVNSMLMHLLRAGHGVAALFSLASPVDGHVGSVVVHLFL